MNSDVNFYFNKAGQWQEEYRKLRSIILSCQGAENECLTEELKWGHPCYTLPAAADGKKRNIVLIHGFKDYCAVLFFKGSLLKDSHHILIQQTENVQSARQVRFTNLEEIDEVEKILKSYLLEAIVVEKGGLKATFSKNTELIYPEEFQTRLSGKNGAALKAAFEALTPGRQRGYNLFFSSPKQSKTREARIEKCIPQILAGKGLND